MAIALTDTVESLSTADLVEFSEERRVRKMMVQSASVVSELVCYEPGQLTKPHVHPNQDEIFFCVEGRGAITFADRDDIPIAQGSIVFVPAGVRHGVATVRDSRLVLMFTKGPGVPHRNREAAAG